MKAAAGRLLTMCNECAYLHIYPAFLPHIYAAIKRRPPHTITIRNRYVSSFIFFIIYKGFFGCGGFYMQSDRRTGMS